MIINLFKKGFQNKTKKHKMIKSIKPLTMNEAKQIAEVNNGKEEIRPYFKKFIKIKEKDAEELKKEIEALNNHKLNQENIVKIVDFLPEDASDLNKLFIDISLDENEIKQIYSF